MGDGADDLYYANRENQRLLEINEQQQARAEKAERGEWRIWAERAHAWLDDLPRSDAHRHNCRWNERGPDAECTCGFDALMEDVP